VTGQKKTQRPDWIRARIFSSGCSERFRSVLDKMELNTVCVEADCPNRGERWNSGNATFIILGDICTRDCRFCNVAKGRPRDLDPEEPSKIADAIRKLGIGYAVITSVTRDDLADGGAEHFRRAVCSIRTACPDVPVELLIPDLFARKELLEKVAVSGASIVGHNVEMPESLYRSLRPASCYQNSIKTLKCLGEMRDNGAKIFVKSSIMLGLGESDKDISKTLVDLKEAGVDVVYMGQYLSPSKEHWPVKKYYTPEEFMKFGKVCLDMGFLKAFSGPMVRSSYRASEIFHSLKDLR